MKLWIVVGFYAGEGYAPPIGVYDSKQAADTAVAKQRQGQFESVDVIEYELNKEQD